MSRFILSAILYAGLQIAAGMPGKNVVPTRALASPTRALASSMHNLQGVLGDRKNGYTFNADVDAWVRVYPVPDTWLNARDRCHQDGAHMVSPTSSDIRDAYKRMMFEKEIATDVYIADLVSEGGSFKCKTLSLAGIVNEVNCGDRLPFICQKEQTIKCKANGYGYEAATGSCYKFHGAARTWRSALRSCHSEGGRLAIINSDIESSILREIFEQKADTITGSTNKLFTFVGLKKYEDGRWATVYGQHIAETGFERWAEGEPNNAGNDEYCGSISKIDGLYNDLSCNKPFSYICEMIP